VKTIDFYSSGSYQQFIVNTKYLQTLKYLVPPKSGKMSSLSLDQLLKACKDEKVIECLSKLQWKGSKPQRCLFTKTNKDTLCDSLIFIAETLFESASDTGESQQFNDNPTSHTQQPTLLSEGTEEDEDSQSQGQSVVNSDDNNSASHTQQPTLLSQGTEGDSQSQNQSAVNSEDNRPTCKLFLENRCPTGIKGQKCTYQHPKQCRKFLQGGRTEHGCQDWECHLLHPRICKNSYLFGSCHRVGCKERHTKDHQLSKKRPEDNSNQSFLWQKQIQEQIDKLANTNLQILQVLNQCQQRPIRVWSQASQQQQQSSTHPSIPSWAATNSQ